LFWFWFYKYAAPDGAGDFRSRISHGSRSKLEPRNTPTTRTKPVWETVFGATVETATGTGALPSKVPAGRPMAVWGGRTGQRARRGISQRDFINQPGVDGPSRTGEERLRRVMIVK